MQEDVIFKRRNRLKKHFVNISNVLLYGYRALSDAAKVTYQIIEGFDWEEKDTGESKGFVFPSIETIAQIRNAAKRTIYRHIQELENVGLLTRVRRRNLPSILYIEDVSDTEANAYLARYVDKVPLPETKKEIAGKTRSAKNGSSQEAREVPKMALAYKDEEHKKKEDEINVNDNFKNVTQRNERGMMLIGSLLSRYDRQKHGLQRSTSNKEKPEAVIRRDYLAEEIANTLGDQKSMGAFRKIAERVPEGVIRECLATTQDTWREGKVKKSRGALFISMIQSYAESHQIALGFRSDAKACTVPEQRTRKSNGGGENETKEYPTTSGGIKGKG